MICFRLIHFPVSDWLKKHQEIEDGLRQQLLDKDGQIEELTAENKLLEEDFEQVRKDYLELKERWDEKYVLSVLTDHVSRETNYV